MLRPMATPIRSPPPLAYSGDESGDAVGGPTELVGLLSGDAGGAGDASTRGESGESGDTVDGGNRGCGEGFVPAAKLTLPLRLRFPSRRLLNNTDAGVYITIHHVAHNKRRCVSLTNGACCKQASARRHIRCGMGAAETRVRLPVQRGTIAYLGELCIRCAVPLWCRRGVWFIIASFS